MRFETKPLLIALSRSWTWGYSKNILSQFRQMHMRPPPVSILMRKSKRHPLCTHRLGNRCDKQSQTQETIMPSQNEIRERITKTIVEALSMGGLAPWRQPWCLDKNCGSPENVVSKRRYRGINPLLLQIASMRHNLKSKWWGTFRQWDSMGGKVMRRPNNVEQASGEQLLFFGNQFKLLKRTMAKKKRRLCS